MHCKGKKNSFGGRKSSFKAHEGFKHVPLNDPDGTRGGSPNNPSLMNPNQMAQNRMLNKSKLANDQSWRALTDSQRQKVEWEARNLFAIIQRTDAQTEGIGYENVEKRILADFYNSAEFARIVKDLGVSGSVLGS